MPQPGLNFTSDADLVDDFVDRPRSAADAGVDTDAPRPLPVQKPLTYDFDIVPIPPDPAQQAHLDALAALGQSTQGLKTEARWRDPRTLAAMRSAGRAVQDVLTEAGFGTTLSESCMPPGHYPVEQDAARHDVVLRLTNLLSDRDAGQFDWGAFSCAEFFKAHAEAEPVRSQTHDAGLPTGSGGPTARTRTLALMGLVGGVVLIAVAVIATL